MLRIKMAILMATAFCCLNLNVIAQSITLKVNSITVKQAMEDMRTRYGYSFVFGVKDVDTQKKISIDVANGTIDELVRQILSGQSLSFDINAKNIIVKRVDTNQSEKTNTVSGVVVDASGYTIIGANVIVKGTSSGVITGDKGVFEIKNVTFPCDLTISFVGYTPKTIRVLNSDKISVVLEENINTVGEVVVTALGIERKAKSLTYATQVMSGSEVNRAKDANMINSLQGKSAGLMILPNSNGAGGSSRMLLRGNKSAQGNNQPLVVIDGVPMANPSSSQVEGVNGGRDGGDAMSNINPDDIASINVLKGASAASLYGSMAANGVIMITTKKGQEGGVKATVTSNIMFETPLCLPELQSRYGAKVVGETLAYKSWGEKITDAPAKDRVKEFFRTGANYINSISIGGGTKYSQTYFSYANTTSKGLMPTNNFIRHNVTVREVLKLLDDKLTVDASINYIKQSLRNRPRSGKYSGVLPGLYTFPANGDFNYYKDNYELYNTIKSRPEQNWYTSVDDFTANPYWTLHRNATYETRNRTMASGKVKYDITPHISVQGRINVDQTEDYYENKIWATTSKTFGDVEKGRYQTEDYDYVQLYMDGLLSYNRTFNDTWDISASVGISMLDFDSRKVRYNSQDAPPVLPNYFVYQNSTGNPLSQQDSPRRRLNSTFGTAQIGYKEMIYLDVTGRNDWASTLAYTDNMSYFYPSFGLTMLLDKMIDMPERINSLKLRGSYSIVGNDMPAYITHPLDGFSKGTLSPNNNAPFSEMKPEKLKSIEFGIEGMFFDRKLSVDLTVYKTNNKNQYFAIDAPAGSGYKSYYINTGDIQNSGFEATIGYNSKIASKVNWYSEVNFSYNKNKIKELDPRLNKDGVKIGSGGGFNFMLKEGGSFGDIYTRFVTRNENGVIQLDNNGFPAYGSDYLYAGNVNPDWLLGWNNTFTYKNLSLYILVDGKIGGKTVALTQSYLDNYGVSKVSADARDNGGVDLGDGTKVDAEKYFSKVSGSTAVGSEYLYSLTNFRLRELSLGYNMKNLLGPSRDLTVSVIARNLFIIYKDSPHDPDMSISTANGYQGIDVFALPSTRSIGLNIKLTF